jgi:hypothetical protein
MSEGVLLEPRRWSKQQITPFDPRRHVFPALGGLGLKSKELLDAYHQIQRPDTPWTLLVDLLVNA